MTPKLTIGLPYVEDFSGLWFTVQALRLYHDLSQVEIVIVDNTPKRTETSAIISGMAEGWFPPRTAGVKYVHQLSPQGTSCAKNRVFQEATGDVVLCMDSHVMLNPNSIKNLIDWFDRHPDCMDLVTGPMWQDPLQGFSTHFDDVWRGHMWGIWSRAWRAPSGQLYSTREHQSKLMYCDLKTQEELVFNNELPELDFYGHEKALREAGHYPLGVNDDDDFEIPGQGCGLFACRREAWLEFNPLFRGFGGEEMYINKKFQQAGRATRCLGFLKWLHRFHRDKNQLPYSVWIDDKARNYVLGLRELGLPLDRCYEHFVVEGNLSQQIWDQIEMNPEKPRHHPAPGKAKAAAPASLFDTIHTTPGDINEHMPKLKDLATKVERVTEFSHRKDSMVAFAFGCKNVESHNTQGAPVLAQAIRETQCNITHDEAPSSQFEEINETDLLFLDTTHTYDYVLNELEKFSPSVTRYIVLHDIVSYGEKGEDGNPGLVYAIKEFTERHPDWFIHWATEKQHGLAVLGRQASDMPSQVIRLWPKGYGPGTEFKKIMQSLGVNPSPGCSCNTLMRQMDERGPDECDKKFDDIVKAIKDNAGHWGWAEALGNIAKATLFALKQPALVMKLAKHPTNPVPVLVREAIDRARKQDTESSKRKAQEEQLAAMRQNMGGK